MVTRRVITMRNALYLGKHFAMKKTDGQAGSKFILLPLWVGLPLEKTFNFGFSMTVVQATFCLVNKADYEIRLFLQKFGGNVLAAYKNIAVAALYGYWYLRAVCAYSPGACVFHYFALLICCFPVKVFMCECR